MLPLLLAAALALGVAAVAAAVRRRSRPLHELVADHSLDASRDRFRATFLGAGLRGDVLDGVHAALVSRVEPHVLQWHPLAPATRLVADLALSPADVEDVALIVAAELGGHIPTAVELDTLDAPVATVETLARFVAFCAERPRAGRRVA